MAARFQPGELVDVHIKGARVVEAASQYFVFETAQADAMSVYADDPQVTIERVAPAEWPPQPGDIWTDRNANEWTALVWDRAVRLYLIDEDNRTREAPDSVLSQVGPMTLVRRRGWTPTPAADVDQADEPERDDQAATAAGLRELADLVESWTLPANWGGFDIAIDVTRYTRYVEDVPASMATIRATAEALGVELTSRDSAEGARHWHAARKFGPVNFRFIYIEDHPATDIAPSPPEEVAGPVAAGPATAPDFELGPTGDHYLAIGTKGGPGECGAECVCGVGFWGFDTLAEAVALLDGHIADPDPRDAEADPYALHAGCDTAARAGTEQTCDRCKRTFVVTLTDDYYCAADSPDHCCEPCLVGVRPVVVVEADPNGDLIAPVGQRDPHAVGVVEQDADALDQLAVAATDPAELEALMPELASLGVPEDLPEQCDECETNGRNCIAHRGAS